MASHRVAPFKPSNAAMFNRDGHGPALYNGMGTTKTRPSPTLFVTNLPAAVTSAELERVFQFDPGFQRIRTVRRMVFVDYDSESAATSGMQRHQNQRFKGVEGPHGIAIDFDKDPRQKRNRCYEQQRNKGTFTHGLAHEGPGTGGGGGSSAFLDALSADGGARVADAADATLALINTLKRKAQQDAGVEVPLALAAPDHLPEDIQVRLLPAPAPAAEKARVTLLKKRKKAKPAPDTAAVDPEATPGDALGSLVAYSDDSDS